jgi:hypothetical protein
MLMENKNTGLELFIENYEYTNKEGKKVKGINLITWMPKPYNPKEVQKVILRTLKPSDYRDILRYLGSK